MAAPTRLSIYNQALRICGERALASLSENREPRRLLDQVWSDESGVDKCLEAGQWNFAMRSVRVDHDPSVDPQFGLQFGFSKPTDWIRTSAFTSDERFQVPYRNYRDEVSYWYADIDPVYVRYVSNDPAFGGDMSKWTASFSDFVPAYFASEIIFKITADKERVLMVEKALKKRKLEALNKDAMNEGTQIPYAGSWVRSRFGRGSPGENDGGNRGSLIG